MARIDSKAGDTSNTTRNIQFPVTVLASKYYLVITMVVTDGTSRAEIGFGSGGNVGRNTTGYLYKKTKPTSDGTLILFHNNFNAIGATGWVAFDGSRVYEITKDIYDLIDVDPFYTGDYLIDKYPCRDRTLSGYEKPIINWTAQDNFNAPDMNKIEQNAQSLATYLQSLQYAIPTLTNVTNRTTATVETFDSFDRFESNIEAIRTNFMTPTGYITSKTWGVGVGLDYTDPNRWQTNLQALFDNAVNVEKGFLYCGGMISGALWTIRAGYTPEEENVSITSL
jgi:hypothetical protein